MNRETRVSHAIVLGLLVALFVCLDPLISADWGIDRLTEHVGIARFPHALSVILAGVLILALLLAKHVRALWLDKERGALLFIIVMAQLNGFALGKLDLLEIAIVILLGFWLIQTFLEERRPLQISPVVFLCSGLVLLSFLTLVNRPPLSGMIAIVEKFVLFFLIVDLLRRRELIGTSAQIVIWAGFFSAVVAILQVIVYAGWGYLWTIGAPDVNPRAFLKTTPFGALPRATAFFPNPASLNDYLLFASAVALFRTAASPTWRQRALYSMTLLAMVVATILTWSTTSLMGLCIMGLVFFYVHRPSLSIQYSAVLTLGVIMAYASGLLESGIQFMKDYGSASGAIRRDLLELGIRSLERNTWIGLGLQNFGRMSGNFFAEGPYVFQYHVHNAFMLMATELGLFGGLGFLGIVIFVSFRLVLALRSSPGPDMWVFKGFLLGWTAILIHMQTEPMAYEGTLWLIFALIEGAGIVVLRESPCRGRPMRPSVALPDGSHP